MGALPIYLIFAAIPFWHLRPFPHISVFEIALLINLLFIPIYLYRSARRLVSTDIIVILFAFYGVITVAVSSTTAYESMRIYRYIVLTPVLLYFIFRVAQLTHHQFARGMVIFACSVVIQAVAVINFVALHGERPAGIPWINYQYQGIVAGIVTFSVLAAMASSAMLYLAWWTKGWKRYILLLIGLVCVTGLLVSATRASSFGFLLFFPLAGWYLRRSYRRILLVAGAYLVLSGIIVTIAMSAFGKPSITLNDVDDNQRAIERIVNIDSYKSDFSGRLSFWATLVRQGLSSPMFGKGMASYDIRLEGDTSLQIGSAHNALVSAFYTSGIFGLSILILLWHSGLQGIYLLNLDEPEARWRACFLTVSFMVLLIVSLTNDLTAGRGNLLLLLLALLSNRPLPRQTI